MFLRNDGICPDEGSIHHRRNIRLNTFLSYFPTKLCITFRRLYACYKSLPLHPWFYIVQSHSHSKQIQEETPKF
jgi:hypothetical protein